MVTFLRDQGSCQPARSGIDISNATNVSAAELGTEFTGLNVGWTREHTGPGPFTIENVALAAIAAMKEGALLQYRAMLLQYDFADESDPENPVRIGMHAPPEAAIAKAKRSTVLWALKTLTVQLMRAQYFHPLPFTVTNLGIPVYLGVVSDRNQVAISQNDTDKKALSAKSLGSPPTLAVMPANSTSVVLQPLSPLQSNPIYYLDFHFSVLPLSQVDVFESILELLLVLAKHDGLDELATVRLSLHRLGVWIFVFQVEPLPVEGHPLQQFQVVAILEAIARHCVRQGLYRELTFALRLDGGRVAQGCVTRALRTREWCRGLVPSNEAGPPAGVNGLVVTD